MLTNKVFFIGLDLTCKQYRKGDRLLKTWAKETNHGQVNAQRCPRCSVSAINNLLIYQI
jgi:hypothetical protein